LLGAQLPLVSALPFVALLAAIAVAPLVAPAWWHSNRHKAIVAGLLSLPILWQFGTALGAPGRAVLGEKLGEYAASIIVIAALFVVFNGWDQAGLTGEEGERPGSQLEQVMAHEPLRVRGAASLAALVGVLLTIIAAGQAAAAGRPWSIGIREAIIAALTLTAYGGTPEENRERNGFTFAPILEVAGLFPAGFVPVTPGVRGFQPPGPGGGHPPGTSF